MKRLVKFLLTSAMFFQLLSCTPSAPYEIRSPCVSADLEGSVHPHPCVRRPINLIHDIG